MGSALVRAMARLDDSPRLLLSSLHPEHAQALADELKAVACADNQMVAASADYILLGVRPLDYPALLQEIKPVLNERAEAGSAPVLVLMAAGYSIAQAQAELGPVADALDFLRIMPNTAVEVGQGLIALAYPVGQNRVVAHGFEELAAAAGQVLEVREDQLDAVTAVSGSGPAYVYQFLQSFIAAACQLGFSAEQAKTLVTQTTLGATELFLAKKQSTQELIAAVCSPGGTTIAGMQALGSERMDAAMRDAVSAAYQRAQEMAGPR
jgi:pyrroline-5-carboxylate reductase